MPDLQSWGILCAANVRMCLVLGVPRNSVRPTSKLCLNVPPCRQRPVGPEGAERATWSGGQEYLPCPFRAHLLYCRIPGLKAPGSIPRPLRGQQSACMRFGLKTSVASGSRLARLPHDLGSYPGRYEAECSFHVSPTARPRRARSEKSLAG